MKSTGIVRRIDELGRIVIPKELRKSLKIKDGELLEIFTNSDEIILKKFSNMNDMEKLFSDYVIILNNLTGNTILITNREKIISSNKQKYVDKELSDELDSFLESRSSILSNDLSELSIINNEYLKINYYIEPLIVNSDVYGLLIMLSKNNINDDDKKMINIASKLIIKQLE